MKHQVHELRVGTAEEAAALAKVHPVTMPNDSLVHDLQTQYPDDQRWRHFRNSDRYIYVMNWMHQCRGYLRLQSEPFDCDLFEIELFRLVSPPPVDESVLLVNKAKLALISKVHGRRVGTLAMFEPLFRLYFGPDTPLGAEAGQGQEQGPEQGQEPGQGPEQGQGPGQGPEQGQGPGQGPEQGQGPGQGPEQGQGPGQGPEQGQGPGQGPKQGHVAGQTSSSPSFEDLFIDQKIDVLYLLMEEVTHYADFKEYLVKNNMPADVLRSTSIYEAPLKKNSPSGESYHLLFDNTALYRKKVTVPELVVPKKRTHAPADPDAAFPDGSFDVVSVSYELIYNDLYGFDQYVAQLSKNKKLKENKTILEVLKQPHFVSNLFSSELRKRKFLMSRKRDLEMTRLLATRKRSSRIEAKEKQKSLDDQKRRDLDLDHLRHAHARRSERALSTRHMKMDYTAGLSREERLHQRKGDSAEVAAAPVSGIPGAPETGVPDAQETGVPDAQETGVPDAQETGVPDAQETGVPDAQETDTPNAQETDTPDAQETDTPDAQETGIKVEHAPEEQIQGDSPGQIAGENGDAN